MDKKSSEETVETQRNNIRISFGIYTRSIAKGTGSDASGPFSDRFTDRHDLEWLGKQPFPFHWLLFKQVEVELVSRQTWKPWNLAE